jgi:hypothetical protein
MDNNNNDDRIIKLRKDIQKKKDSLKEIKKFTPITNCILLIDGETINLNVLTSDDLIKLHIRLNAYILSAKDLKMDLNTILFNGFCLTDWIEDIKNKIFLLQTKDESKKLKMMEEVLTKLLSEQKKTELELDEIESLLKKG